MVTLLLIGLALLFLRNPNFWRIVAIVSAPVAGFFVSTNAGHPTLGAALGGLFFLAVALQYLLVRVRQRWRMSGFYIPLGISLCLFYLGGLDIRTLVGHNFDAVDALLGLMCAAEGCRFMFFGKHKRSGKFSSADQPG